MRKYDTICPMLLAQSFIFVLGTVSIVYFSYRSLRKPGSHGFYRFFSWETILILFVKNIPVWFSVPLSWHQIISWLLLVICCLPLIMGVRSLNQAHKPIPTASSERLEHESLFEFEKTSALVTTGIFKYIRHPMYSSLLLLAWGIFFKRPDWLSLLLALAASLSLVATARVEEVENIRYFGPSYREYMRRTRKFIPFLF